MAELRVTPEVLESQGGDLVEYSENLQEILDSIEAKINEIIDGWDGIAQDAYLNKYTEMKESLKQFPELINTLGLATQSAAQAYMDVDNELKSAFSR